MRNINPIDNDIATSTVNTGDYRKNPQQSDKPAPKSDIKENYVDKVGESIKRWNIESAIINVYACLMILGALTYVVTGTFFSSTVDFTSLDYFINVLTLIFSIMLLKRVSFARIFLLALSWTLFIALIAFFILSGLSLFTAGILMYFEFGGIIFSIVLFSLPAIKRHF